MTERSQWASRQLVDTAASGRRTSLLDTVTSSIIWLHQLFKEQL